VQYCYECDCLDEASRPRSSANLDRERYCYMTKPGLSPIRQNHRKSSL